MDNKRYRFNEEKICPTDFGNINFGYAGSALGIPSDVLLVFAGVFELKDHHGYSFTKALYSAVFEKGIDQWYGDQKDDFEKSTWGISLFYSGY